MRKGQPGDGNSKAYRDTYLHSHGLIKCGSRNMSRRGAESTLDGGKKLCRLWSLTKRSWYFSIFKALLCILTTTETLFPNIYRLQRSCEGYVFTRVCDSVHRRDAIPAYIAVGIRACLWGVYSGGVCSGGCLLWGVSAPGGACSGGHLLWGCRDPPKADGYCCGRYASYWKAFLFHITK